MGGRGIERIEERISPIFGERWRMHIPRGRCAEHGLWRITGQQDLHTQFWEVARDTTAHEAARITTFIHQPDPNFALRGFVNSVAHLAKPSRREILNRQPLVGPDHHAADTVAAHVVQVAPDVRLGHGTVPEPPQGHGVLGRWVGEFGPCLAVIRDIDSAPGLRRRKGTSSQDQQDRDYNSSSLTFRDLLHYYSSSPASKPAERELMKPRRPQPLSLFVRPRAPVSPP